MRIVKHPRPDYRVPMTGAPSDDTARPRFELIAGGLDPNQPSPFGRAFEPPPPRPKLRKKPLPEPVLFRIRIDLDEATPPIWRRLEIRSDLTLDVVHRAIQASYAWLDYHLHRFSLGGGPFEYTSELFLCPFDVAEGEDEGSPADEVRLDETMHEPGDTLHYVYDYGDDWRLTLRLEEIIPLTDDASPARCIDGERAAPPEDCGHLVDAADLARVLDDPAHFDVDAVTTALNDPIERLATAGVDRRLHQLLRQLRRTEWADDLTRRAQRLLDDPDPVSPEELTVGLRPYLWFLTEAGDDGFPLTAAGYLKPAVVPAACAVVPEMNDWIGARTKESDCYPLLHFRESLQKIGLLRKHKGRLLRTKRGTALANNPVKLLDYLAQKITPTETGTFESECDLLTLFFTATSDDGPLPRQLIADLLNALDWRRGNAPLRDYDVRGAVYGVLTNVSGPIRFAETLHPSPTAIALARRALSN